MEHRYLKVLDSNFIDQATSDYDNLSYTITSDELNELGINLIRICRELIILLCFTVNINENNINKDEKDKEGNYIRRELYAGSICRRFYVGDAVSEEDIHAKYEDGILKLSVPKKAPEKIEKDGYIAIEG